MTETEKKALALLIEVREERGGGYDGDRFDREIYSHEALCRAIEQHEAYKQEVSDAVERWSIEYLLGDNLRQDMARFIIAKPDPLVEALDSAPYLASSKELAAHIRAAIEKRGGKIVWGEG